MKKILVTGARGYLGHATCILLKQKGYHPIGIDLKEVKKPLTENFPCYLADLRNFDSVREVFEKEKTFDGVIHFAAKALVSESCEKPHLYFHNNIVSTLNTVDLASQYGVPYFIQSSSCSVYGIPSQNPIAETTPLKPVSPYGESKRLCEQVLENYSSRGLKVLCLRYFNPAGSLLNATWGESHEPETHILPNLVSAFLKKTAFSVYGTDYPTPDGSCVRDFIHVEDLVEAHLRGLHYLEEKSKSPFDFINIGTGRGTSVLETVRSLEKLCSTSIEVKKCERRPGDPPALVADNKKMVRLLEWAPSKSIDEMIRDHISWARSSL